MGEGGSFCRPFGEWEFSGWVEEGGCWEWEWLLMSMAEKAIMTTNIAVRKLSCSSVNAFSFPIYYLLALEETPVPTGNCQWLAELLVCN